MNMKMDPYTYLAFRRMVIFLDEWCFYMMLLYTYFHLCNTIEAIAIGVFGTPLIIISYYYLNRLEDAMGIYDPNTYKIWKINDVCQYPESNKNINEHHKGD